MLYTVLRNLQSKEGTMNKKFKAWAIAILILLAFACVAPILFWGTDSDTTETLVTEQVSNTYTESKQYSLENQNNHEEYEYKLVYKASLTDLYKSLYFNVEGPFIKSNGSRYIRVKDEDFELYIREGTLWLTIGDKKVVTTEFSVTNDW